MGDAVIDDRIARLRRRLILAAALLAVQLGATLYGYLPLATVRFRSMTGTEPPGLYVGNEWFAWQVVQFGSLSELGPANETNGFTFVGLQYRRLTPSFWFVRVNVLWTIVPNVAIGAVGGLRLRQAIRQRRAADPAFDRGFAVESTPIACCPTCGQRLPAAAKSPSDVARAVASRTTLP